MLQWIALLFWPVVLLIIFGCLAGFVWHEMQPGWGRTLVFILPFLAFVWFVAVAVTDVIFLVTGYHTRSIWLLFWPVAVVIFLVAVFLQLWQERHLQPTWPNYIVMPIVAILALYVALVVVLPRIASAADHGFAYTPGMPRTTATSSWATYHPDPSGYKCLTKVTGVTREQAKTYGRLVRAKKYDPRELIVVDEQDVNATVARLQAFAEGIPQVHNLRVTHVNGIWVFGGSSCKATWYAKPGVLVSATIPILRNHPVTSRFRRGVGVLPSPLGPWRVALPPAA